MKGHLLACISASVSVPIALLPTKVVLPKVLFNLSFVLEIPDALITIHMKRLSKDGP